MYNDLIEKYIDFLTIDHVKMYAKEKNIIINNSEAEIIYRFIKDNYKSLTNGNLDNLLPLKNKLNTTTYNNLILLYKNACIKYLSN